MEHTQDLLKKIQNVKTAINVIIAEIKKLDKNISISQGLHDDNGFYRLICREINYAKENIWSEYNLSREFFPPIKYNGIIEPDFKNESILMQLNEFKTLLENTSFNDFESFEKFITEQQQYIINLK